MRLMRRIRTLMSAGVNDLLDRAEKPDVMVNQIVRDMERAVVEMRGNTASVMATARLSEKKLEKTSVERDQWLRNAESAVKEGNDDLAKKALLRKRALEQNVSLLSSQLAECRTLEEKMREELRLVDGRLHEAKLKRENLAVRKRAAVTMQRLYDASARFSRLLEQTAGASELVLEGHESFAGFEEKVERHLAEIEAREELRGTNLEKEFQRLRMDRELDEELWILKRGILGQAAQEAIPAP